MRLWPVLSMLVVCPSLAEQWMVLESTDPSLHQGKMLDGGRILSVATGSSVILVSQSGRERQVHGPFDDPPDSLLTPESRTDPAPAPVPAVGATRALEGADPKQTEADVRR